MPMSRAVTGVRGEHLGGAVRIGCDPAPPSGHRIRSCTHDGGLSKINSSPINTGTINTRKINTTTIKINSGTDPLAVADPAVAQLITDEERLQHEALRLIPSENYVSAAELKGSGSVLQNKDSED